MKFLEKYNLKKSPKLTSVDKTLSPVTTSKVKSII